ncbi:MAG TPA: acyl-CoA thioesterase [Arenimonas sp.]|nr:acyl-CoA thioesterase [Arenimonas sp.]
MSLSPAFHDVDVMEIVWHGHYVKYFEIARCALLQSFDYDYPQMRASGYAWPIVDLRSKYVRPARYGQALVVRASLVEWENRLKIDYQVRDADTGEVLTRASTIQVAVDLATGEMCFASPQVLFDKLGKTP